MKLTKKQRCELQAKFAGHCAYCGVLLGDRWHADHKEAVWREPERVNGKCTGAIILGLPENHTISNMMPACVPCNLSKAAMPLEIWRKRIADHVNSLNSYHPIYRLAKSYGLIVETGKPVVFHFETVGPLSPFTHRK